MYWLLKDRTWYWLHPGSFTPGPLRRGNRSEIGNMRFEISEGLFSPPNPLKGEHTQVFTIGIWN